MKGFENKNILVCVTAGIACYKMLDVVSKLRKAKANIKVIMTENATRFVSPLTFQAVGNCKVYTDMWNTDRDDIEHISLKDFAEYTIVSPTSANIIGKFNSGIADDLLSTVFLGLKTPVLIVPAMNTDMYENKIVQQNIKNLKKLGYFFMEPDEGVLACGVKGKGRMPEPDSILNQLKDLVIVKNKELKGKRFLITLGATREYFDDVRFLSNPSTGRMGSNIIKVLLDKGANVKAICASVDVDIDNRCEIIKVISAQDMYEKVFENYNDIDCFISTAAVCDFKPEKKYNGKLKKDRSDLNNIKFVKNPDILKETLNLKKEVFRVGFAAESDDIEENAKRKLKNKQLDLIVLNDISRKDIGFKSENNEVYIIDKEFLCKKIHKTSKYKIATNIIQIIQKNL